MTNRNYNKKKILIRLGKGVTTIKELKELVDIYLYQYKSLGKKISDYIELQSFTELLRRLQTSVFSELGRAYPAGFKKYCIYAEYHNTKLFIETTKKLILVGSQHGDITNHKFYGQPDSGYKVSYETMVHILLRHNETINILINKDSTINGYNPSSFGFGVIASSMLTMLMALNVIQEDYWIEAEKGKNLICHFAIGGQLYTLIRKGRTKEIISFYPRNDESVLKFIKLKRNPDKMQFEIA